LIWDLPALDSMRINAAVYRIDRSEFQARLEELSSMLGVADHLRQPVRKLSLGERMKVELMAALLHRPSILFLDEPTLGLDVNAQSAVREFLRQYNARYNATILLTSHYMADITALCRRVLVIHHGKLMYDGKLDHLVERFAPYREVTLELNQGVSEEVLSQYGEIESVEGCEVRLIVRRENLTPTVVRLLRDLDVQDLTVAEPPIEPIIGRLFEQGIES